jgi:hypothetical protein
VVYRRQLLVSSDQGTIEPDWVVARPHGRGPASTREEWLACAGNLLRHWFSGKGIVLPDNLRIACGWPLGGQRNGCGRGHADGQCWPRRASGDGTAEIFVSPELEDVRKVLGVVTHEFVHAADDNRNGHGKPFRNIAIAVGLRGPMRSTFAGPELAERLNASLLDLGPYPHARLDPAQVKRTQGTRLIKVVCDRNNRFVVTESAIDALSHAVLFPDDNARYASMGGKPNPQQPELIRAAVARMPVGSEIVAAMDADTDGAALAAVVRRAVELSGRSDLRFVMQEPFGFKDWNDQLRARPKPPLPCRPQGTLTA